MTTSAHPPPGDREPTRSRDVPARRPGGRRDDTVTTGMHIAAAWSWRILVVAGAAAVVYLGLGYVSEITVPATIALLLCAFLNPFKRFLLGHGWGSTWAAVVVFVVGILVVAGVVALVVEQFVAGTPKLADQVSGGLGQIQNWLVNGPLHLSQAQIDSALNSAKEAVAKNRDALTSTALSTAGSIARVVTGLVLTLFTLFFFLRDGRKIFLWLVGLTPRRARSRIVGAADEAWTTLNGYVRATVAVAFVDAVGIGLGLVILGVPLALPLTAFVFLASFIPIAGALVSGVVAVLVALVAVGVVKAIIVLAVVIAVNQLEAHVLQPVLMGRAVRVHPLAIALSITAGVIIAGIAGALLAVPLIACANVAVKYLAARATGTELPIDADPEAGSGPVTDKAQLAGRAAADAEPAHRGGPNQAALGS